MSEINDESSLSEFLRNNITDEAGSFAQYDSAYRRGVSQALNFAADLMQYGITYEDMCWLVNESLKMRVSNECYPAYLDVLNKRYRAKKKL